MKKPTLAVLISNSIDEFANSLCRNSSWKLSGQFRCSITYQHDHCFVPVRFDSRDPPI